MNGILIGVIALLAVFGYAGWRKGIIRIIVAFVSMIVSIIATIFLAPAAGEMLKKNTPVYTKLNESVYNFVLKDEKLNQAADDAIGNESQSSIHADYLNEINQYVNHLTSSMGMSDAMVDEVMKIESVASDNIENGLDTVKDVVLKTFADRVTVIIYRLIVYVIVFVIVYIIIRLIAAILDMIGRLPVLRELNRIGGCIFGIAEGLVLIWLVFAVASVCSGMDWATIVIDGINGSQFLTFINDHNLIMKIIFNNII